MMINNRKYSKETLEKAVKESTSIRGAFLNMGLKYNGGNQRWLRNRIEEFSIDTSHFRLSNKGSSVEYSSDDISNDYRRGSEALKKFLDYHNRVYECSKCGISSWLGVNLVLDIDHIDGNGVNNSLNNLQYLCPNCHRLKTKEQLLEKTLIRQKEKQNYCECGKAIDYKSKNCVQCSSFNRIYPTKINWPDNQVLREEVWRKSMNSLSKELGVTRSAVIRHCKKNEILYPPKVYWNYFRFKRFEKCLEIRRGVESSLD